MTNVGVTIQKPLPQTSDSWNTGVKHPLQTWEWGDFRQSMGIDVVRLNGWQLTFHRIPYTPWTIGYFPKGPKPTSAMLKQLTALGRGKNAILIQLEPNVPAGKNTESDTKLPLVPSHRPLFTKV